MHKRWTLDDIPWERFDPKLVDPNLLAVVKTAALVESNAADYVQYLQNIFPDDAEIVSDAIIWGQEEAQHGAALARWAEMADPNFNSSRALTEFRRTYALDLEATQSIRGSGAGELIARQVVETGTSSFYSAIRDAAKEPVLRAIAARIASDEYFHYRLFARHGKRHLQQAPLTFLARARIALTRFQEAEDDELARAYYAANFSGMLDAPNYETKRFGREYWARSMGLYNRRHIATGVRMILIATGLAIGGWLERSLSWALWQLVQKRTAALRINRV
jgi:rubrerythrin